MSQKLISIRRNDKSNLFMDQDTFNKAFNSKMIYVSPKYNYMFGNREHFQYRPEDIASFYNLGIEEMEKIIEYPVILYFTDSGRFGVVWCRGKNMGSEERHI